MGQKINPTGLRIGITESWRSRWFGKKDFARLIGEDFKIRKFVKLRLEAAGIARIDIERAASRVKVNIFTAKPGLVIGKKGKEIEELRKELRGLVGRDVSLNIIEVRKPDIDANLIAQSIATQLEKRINYRRAMKDAVSKARRMGAEGIKVKLSGRLNGAEIARTEFYKEGRVPLQTLRADIDYGLAEAKTTYGLIGIKAWVFKGEKYTPGEEPVLEMMQL